MYSKGALFGRWEVLAELPERHRGGRVYLCRCLCGAEKAVPKTYLQSGYSRSCGCLQKELSRARQTRHGMFGTPEYNAWMSMWARCTNPKHKAFANYGGRGIKVCAAWKDFAKFYADVGPKPSAKHQLDRERNSKGYTRSNTRWVLPVANIRNRRATVKVLHNGQVKPLAVAAEAEGLKYATVLARLRAGWAPEKLFEKVK